MNDCGGVINRMGRLTLLWGRVIILNRYPSSIISRLLQKFKKPVGRGSFHLFTLGKGRLLSIKQGWVKRYVLAQQIQQKSSPFLRPVAD